MNHTNKNTAILLFAKSSSAEVQEKNFVKGASLKRNENVSERLNIEAHRKCIGAGLPVFHIDEKAQKGSNFAERLQNSLSQVFKQGYDNIIAVGNDCPLLSVGDIKRAEDSIKQGKAILGETHRGGIYLIGLSKGQFQNLDLHAISWGSKNVFKELFNALEGSSELFLLKKKTEYNSENDLKEITYYLNDQLHRWLLSQANKPEPEINDFISLQAQELADLREYRGPPVI